MTHFLDRVVGLVWLGIGLFLAIDQPLLQDGINFLLAGLCCAVASLYMKVSEYE